MVRSVMTESVEVPISPDGVIRIEGLQRDRRRRNDLRIILPDGRVIRAHGRGPAEDGWEVYFEDESETIIGDNLVASLAHLMGYKRYWDEDGDRPDWTDRLSKALAGSSDIPAHWPTPRDQGRVGAGTHAAPPRTRVTKGSGLVSRALPRSLATGGSSSGSAS
jgi:hypothetical protein